MSSWCILYLRDLMVRARSVLPLQGKPSPGYSTARRCFFERQSSTVKLHNLLADPQAQTCSGLSFRSTVSASAKVLEELLPVLRPDPDTGILDRNLNAFNPLPREGHGSDRDRPASRGELDRIIDQIAGELGDPTHIRFDPW